MCTLSESAASTVGVNAIPLSTRVNLTIDMWRKIIKFALTSLNLPLFSLDNLGDNHQTCLFHVILLRNILAGRYFMWETLHRLRRKISLYLFIV